MISANILQSWKKNYYINAWGDYAGGSRPKLETTQIV
jgi:hypothetical protein